MIWGDGGHMVMETATQWLKETDDLKIGNVNTDERC